MNKVIHSRIVSGLIGNDCQDTQLSKKKKKEEEAGCFCIKYAMICVKTKKNKECINTHIYIHTDAYTRLTACICL